MIGNCIFLHYFPERFLPTYSVGRTKMLILTGAEILPDVTTESNLDEMPLNRIDLRFFLCPSWTITPSPNWEQSEKRTIKNKIGELFWNPPYFPHGYSRFLKPVDAMLPFMPPVQYGCQETSGPSSLWGYGTCAPITALVNVPGTRKIWLMRDGEEANVLILLRGSRIKGNGMNGVWLSAFFQSPGERYVEKINISSSF